MDLYTTYIVIGIAIGFLVAAPIGPIGIFCIRQASANGLLAGIITGLGASIADAVYTVIAGYGASFVEQWIREYLHWFELTGGFFLIYVANKIKSASVQLESEGISRKSNLLTSCWTTMIMTFLSPMTTFLFLAMFGKFGVLNDQLTTYRIGYLAIGVFFGALIWWIILSFIVVKLVKTCKEMNPQTILKGPYRQLFIPLTWIAPKLKMQSELDIILVINRLSAFCIFIFGILMIFSGIEGVFFK
ncbi:MAG: hypothetical protein CMM87_01505 [Rickettsiales bacterium]|nr:hypothetical protein [Rickettsiales bacterium]|tara:strand:- start:20915 stop:21649 length:735 start_codon:yes stop_codon:yes gene_type:complete